MICWLIYWSRHDSFLFSSEIVAHLKMYVQNVMTVMFTLWFINASGAMFKISVFYWMTNRLGARRPERCQSRWIKTLTDCFCSVTAQWASSQQLKSLCFTQKQTKLFLCVLKTQDAVWLNQPTFFIKSLKSMKIFSSSIIQSIEPPQMIKHDRCRWSGGGEDGEEVDGKEGCQWRAEQERRRWRLKRRRKRKDTGGGDEREHERRRWRKKERRKRDRMIHALASSRAKRRI